MRKQIDWKDAPALFEKGVRLFAVSKEHDLRVMSLAYPSGIPSVWIGHDGWMALSLCPVLGIRCECEIEEPKVDARDCNDQWLRPQDIDPEATYTGKQLLAIFDEWVEGRGWTAEDSTTEEVMPHDPGKISTTGHATSGPSATAPRVWPVAARVVHIGSACHRFEVTFSAEVYPSQSGWFTDTDPAPYFESNKAMGKRIVQLEESLRDIRRGILCYSKDTVWISEAETVVDRINGLIGEE